MDHIDQKTGGTVPPRLRSILTSILEVDSISMDDTPESIANWDSLRHLNLVLAVEQEFKVSFETERIPELNSVRAICSALGIVAS